MKKTLTAFLVIISIHAIAQTDSIPPPLQLTGYIETYYSYDFGKPSNNNRPGFAYSHNRHNEVNLNLGLLKLAYQKEYIRANMALMAGTYTNANLAAEPGVLKNVFEANAGFRLSTKNDLWIDAGIMPSHIGFESAVGKDCWNLTRTILADNSPYFETGAKISYNSKNGKWLVSGLLLNGWQRIQRPDGNSTPAFGHQVTYKSKNGITLNSSSFIGNDKPDSIKQMRYFHNFYGIFQLTDKFAITTGFDIGAQQQSKGSNNYHTWYASVIVLKINPDAKNAIAARAEYYSDKNGVIISGPIPDGFKTWGYSLNYDYLIRERILWRIEARGFKGKDRTFEKEGQPASTNFFVTTSLAISF